MEKAKVITLNGITKGFAIYLEEQKDFIRDECKSNEPSLVQPNIKLFKNLETAKAELVSRFNIVDPYDYKIWLIINNKQIDYCNIHYIEPYYEYYDKDGTHYYIQETVTEKVINIGYFVFEDGEEKKICDPKIGTKKSKQLYGYIKQVISSIISFPDLTTAIERIYRDSNGFLCLKIKGTTSKIHILYNSQIMDLNMKRREDNIRCIPYNKDMDKYKSIFIFATKDSSDYDSQNYTDTLIELILEELNYNYYELNPRYIPVNFNGNILLGDNIN